MKEPEYKLVRKASNSYITFLAGISQDKAKKIKKSWEAQFPREKLKIEKE